MFWGGFYLDPFGILFLLPALALAMYAQFKVQSTFNKYLQVPARSGLSGAQVARRILDDVGLHDVPVELTHGHLTDHYDPRRRVMRRSQTSTTAPPSRPLGVAAHETGHALQHKENYVPLSVRNQLFPVASIGSTMAFPLFFIGLFFGAPGLSDTLMNLGIWLFAAAVGFQVVTLPVEFNASSRVARCWSRGDTLSVTRCHGRCRPKRRRTDLRRCSGRRRDAVAASHPPAKRSEGLRRPVSRPSRARVAALRALVRVEEDRAYAPLALAGELSSMALERRDRALATELVYGVLRWQGRIDHYLQHFSNRPIQKLTSWSRGALRLALYQVIWLDSVPAPVACSESVLLVKEKEPWAAGFVNGVCRAFTRRWREVPVPDQESDPVAFLSTVHSHPEWLVRRWVARWGEERALAVCQSNNEPAPVTVRVNLNRTRVDILAKRLEAAGVGVEPGKLLACGASAHRRRSGRTPPGYEEGHFQVQDESSQLVGWIVDPGPSDRIVDLCAGPGGKSTHLAELAVLRARGEGGNVPPLLSVDVHPHKTGLVKSNALRLGVDRQIRTMVADATKITSSLDETFDKVLVDAPCSGSGVLRRRPDLRWQRTPSEIDKLVAVQREILRSAARLVAPGGVLVYSTCSLEDEENRGNVEWFLTEFPEFRPRRSAHFCQSPQQACCVSRALGWIFSPTSLEQTDSSSFEPSGASDGLRRNC